MLKHQQLILSALVFAGKEWPLINVKVWGHSEWHYRVGLLTKPCSHIEDTCPLGSDILPNKRTIKG